MRALLLLLAACAALLPGGCSGGGGGSDVAHPALWRAVRGGATIWLFGTVHLLPAALRWRSATLDRAIAASDALVLEVPQDPAARQAAAFLQAARTQTAPPTAQRVAPPLRGLLARRAQAADVDLAQLDRLKSWGAAVLLSSGGARGTGATRAAAPEAVLTQAFADRGKPCLALETLSAQFAAFDALGEPEQRALLASAVRGDDDFARTMTAWSRGDTGALAATAAPLLAVAPGAYRTLVTDRNARWAAKLDRLARPGRTVFVAVGAGHLTGPGALQGMLTARGFRVARIQ